MKSWSLKASDGSVIPSKSTPNKASGKSTPAKSYPKDQGSMDRFLTSTVMRRAQPLPPSPETPQVENGDNGHGGISGGCGSPPAASFMSSPERLSPVKLSIKRKRSDSNDLFSENFPCVEKGSNMKIITISDVCHIGNIQSSSNCVPSTVVEPVLLSEKTLSDYEREILSVVAAACKDSAISPSQSMIPSCCQNWVDILNETLDWEVCVNLPTPFDASVLSTFPDGAPPSLPAGYVPLVLSMVFETSASVNKVALDVYHHIRKAALLAGCSRSALDNVDFNEEKAGNYILEITERKKYFDAMVSPAIPAMFVWEVIPTVLKKLAAAALPTGLKKVLQQRRDARTRLFSYASELASVIRGIRDGTKSLKDAMVIMTNAASTCQGVKSSAKSAKTKSPSEVVKPELVSVCDNATDAPVVISDQPKKKHKKSVNETPFSIETLPSAVDSKDKKEDRGRRYDEFLKMRREDKLSKLYEIACIKEERRIQKEHDAAADRRKIEEKKAKQRALFNAFVVKKDPVVICINGSPSKTVATKISVSATSPSAIQFSTQNLKPLFRPWCPPSGAILGPVVTTQDLHHQRRNIEDILSVDGDAHMTPSDDTRTLYQLELCDGRSKMLPKDLNIVKESSGVNCIHGNRRPMKYLYFHNNNRPPYLGTYSRCSRLVVGSAPLTLDDSLFDYSVDSDEEWQEEEPGDDVDAADDEEEDDGIDKNELDDSDDDDPFLVPDGYLSDDERPLAGRGDGDDDMCADGDGGMYGGDDDDDAMNFDEFDNACEREKRLKNLQKEQDRKENMKRSKVVKHEIVVGPILDVDSRMHAYFMNYDDINDTEMDIASLRHLEHLCSRTLPNISSLFGDANANNGKPIRPSLPLSVFSYLMVELVDSGRPVATVNEKVNENSSLSGQKRKWSSLTEDEAPVRLLDLCRMVHQSPLAMKDLLDKVVIRLPSITKTSIETKIKEIAQRVRRTKGFVTWEVYPMFLSQIGMDPLVRNTDALGETDDSYISFTLPPAPIEWSVLSDEEAAVNLIELCRFIHQSPLSLKDLVIELVTRFPLITKGSIGAKVREISKRVRRGKGKGVWIYEVSPSILSANGIDFHVRNIKSLGSTAESYQSFTQPPTEIKPVAPIASSNPVVMDSVVAIPITSFFHKNINNFEFSNFDELALWILTHAENEPQLCISHLSNYFSSHITNDTRLPSITITGISILLSVIVTTTASIELKSRICRFLSDYNFSDNDISSLIRIPEYELAVITGIRSVCETADPHHVFFLKNSLRLLLSVICYENSYNMEDVRLFCGHLCTFDWLNVILSLLSHHDCSVRSHAAAVISFLLTFNHARMSIITSRMPESLMSICISKLVSIVCQYSVVNVNDIGTVKFSLNALICLLTSEETFEMASYVMINSVALNELVANITRIVCHVGQSIQDHEPPIVAPALTMLVLCENISFDFSNAKSDIELWTRMFYDVSLILNECMIVAKLNGYATWLSDSITKNFVGRVCEF